MPRLKKRILYVDSNADAGSIMSAFLGLSGYEVRTAGTAAEGLRLAKSERFDLYLLDQVFPDGEGLELCRLIRACSPHTPVLFFSAAPPEVYRQPALLAGAQDYLRKPEDLEALEPTITRLIYDAEVRASH